LLISKLEFGRWSDIAGQIHPGFLAWFSIIYPAKGCWWKPGNGPERIGFFMFIGEIKKGMVRPPPDSSLIPD